MQFQVSSFTIKAWLGIKDQLVRTTLLSVIRKTKYIEEFWFYIVGDSEDRLFVKM